MVIIIKWVQRSTFFGESVTVRDPVMALVVPMDTKTPKVMLSRLYYFKSLFLRMFNLTSVMTST